MAKKNRMTIHVRDEVMILDLGEVEIWDGADLALLRETLTRLIEQDGCRSVGVDLGHVKYIPSGFFGMLYDWHDKGIAIRLYSPLPHVQNMLWFRQFFALDAAGNAANGYLLVSDTKETRTPDAAAEWHADSSWSDHNQSRSIAATRD